MPEAKLEVAKIQSPDFSYWVSRPRLRNQVGQFSDFVFEKNSKWEYIPGQQFLGNFREKSKKVPQHTVSKKFLEIPQSFPKKLRALLLDIQLRTGNFF
jgi:hypothetical protein